MIVVVRWEGPGVIPQEDGASSSGRGKITFPAEAPGVPRPETSGIMRTWTASTIVAGRPEDVLDVLTDPDAVERWAPVPFDVEDLDCDRLRPGSRARVSGRLAGRRVGFDVHVHAAGLAGLELTADGPVALDVVYELRPARAGSEVVASVGVTGRGLSGRLLAQATEALLAGGALHHALARIARDVEGSYVLAA